MTLLKEADAEALRTLIGPNCPEQVHLGPSRPLPIAHSSVSARLHSAVGTQTCSELFCRRALFQSCLWPSLKNGLQPTL